MLAVLIGLFCHMNRSLLTLPHTTAMQVEHQKRVASLKHEVVDLAEQERRKALVSV